MQYQRFNPKDFVGKLISEYTCEERIRYNAYKAHIKKVLQIDEKYSTCLIYRISIPGDKGSYIGHTINKKSRMILHKHCTKNWEKCTSNQKLYKAIAESIGGWSEVHFEVLEYLPTCKNKMEAEHHEQRWIDKLRPSLNTSEVRYHASYTGFSPSV